MMTHFVPDLTGRAVLDVYNSILTERAAGKHLTNKCISEIIYSLIRLLYRKVLSLSGLGLYYVTLRKEPATQYDTLNIMPSWLTYTSLHHIVRKKRVARSGWWVVQVFFRQATQLL